MPHWGIDRYATPQSSIDPYNLTVKRYCLAHPLPAAREFPLREAFASARLWLKNPPNSQNFSLVYRPFPCYNKLVFANTPFYIKKEMYPLWQQRKAA